MFYYIYDIYYIELVPGINVDGELQNIIAWIKGNLTSLSLHIDFMIIQYAFT